MEIIISNIIQVKEPTKEIKDYCKQELTIPNPEYNKKRQMGFWTANTPKNIHLYDYDDHNIYLPIGCFVDLWQMYPDKSLYKDHSVKVHRDIKSNIKLRDYQEPCRDALKVYVNGLFILPCGLGKTECALETAHYLQQHTLFITHTKDLLNQAKERCEEKMNCSVSVISDGKVDTSGDIVFATVQTLFKNLDKISQDEFGLVVVDECFPAGTKINTPNGYKNIEDIKKGDYVYSYNHDKHIVEIKKVDYLFSKDTDERCIIKTSNGNSIVCTPNHPIYTNSGYIKADKIKKGDVIYEMHSMWEDIERERLYKRTNAKEEKSIQENKKSILFQRLFKKIHNRKSKSICSYRKSIKSNEIQQSVKERRNTKKDIKHSKEDRSQTMCSWWKWSWFNNSTRNTTKRNTRNISKCDSRTRNNDTHEKRFGIPNVLQIGYWYRRIKNWYRSRWLFAHCFGKTRTGYEKDYVLREYRVESVEIYKQGSNGRTTKNNGGNKVYNIGVKDNHNYFVNGILVHNCHHTSANADSVSMFRTTIDYFAARYKLGLTATLHRADGLEKCIPKLLGDVLYEIEEDKNEYVGVYEGNEVIRFPKDKFQVPAKVNVIETNYSLYDIATNSYRDVFDKNGLTISFSKLISDISCDKKRNEIIISLCNSLKGSTIVLSDRVEQLKYLAEHINGSVEIDGSTKKRDREQAIADIKSGNKKVLLASYKLAKEGLDCKILENVVFATPVKDEAIVIQCIGRAQRTYENKKVANIYDLVDDVSMLAKFFTKRKSVYKKKGWLD